MERKIKANVAAIHPKGGNTTGLGEVIKDSSGHGLLAAAMHLTIKISHIYGSLCDFNRAECSDQAGRIDDILEIDIGEPYLGCLKRKTDLQVEVALIEDKRN